MFLLREKKENRIETLGRDQRGLTLVELIIVVAIVAVIGTGVMFSVNLIFSANAKTCANSLKSAIADCKITTMGKQEAWMEIYRDTNGNVYYQIHTKEKDPGGALTEVVLESEKIGGKRVVVKYTDSAGILSELTAGGGHIKVSFNRASGSFTDDTCQSIEVIGGGRHYTLTFTKLTGKVTVTCVTT